MILSIPYYFVAMDHDSSSGKKMETRFFYPAKFVMLVRACVS